MTRVLVVDDDEDVRILLIEMLRSAGFDAAAATTGLEALEEVRTQEYDVLVTDLLMPEADGLDVIKAARQAGRAAAVVAISGGSPRMPASIGLRLCEAFGADRVLFKPFGKAELVAAVNEALAERSKVA
jgi:CheY-like chemotaxis protein